jgi:hypothetical protein
MQLNPGATLAVSLLCASTPTTAQPTCAAPLALPGALWLPVAPSGSVCAATASRRVYHHATLPRPSNPVPFRATGPACGRPRAQQPRAHAQRASPSAPLPAACCPPVAPRGQHRSRLRAMSARARLLRPAAHQAREAFSSHGSAAPDNLSCRERRMIFREKPSKPCRGRSEAWERCRDTEAWPVARARLSALRAGRLKCHPPRCHRVVALSIDCLGLGSPRARRRPVQAAHETSTSSWHRQHGYFGPRERPRKANLACLSRITVEPSARVALLLPQHQRG